jgi:uncharacterized protein YegL
MAEVVANAGQDTGRTVQQDGQTYRVLSGGTTRIDLLNEGVRAYQAELLGDSLAAQRVEVSVITFGAKVETVVPFISALEFIAPTLTANGETPMGAAILQAIDAVTERKRAFKQSGLHYFRPWIFLITDGQPTDPWQTAAAKVREGVNNKSFVFFVVGVEGANFDILRQISPRTPARLKGYSFREMFIWLSQSMRTVSHSNPGIEEDQLTFPPPDDWRKM